MYTAGLEETWELFAPYLAGNPSGLAAVVSDAPLGGAAHTAIIKSVAAFGYGEGACTFVTLSPATKPAENEAEAMAASEAEGEPGAEANGKAEAERGTAGATDAEAEGVGAAAADAADVPRLGDPQALFLLIEGLDPLFLIVCDDAAARQLEAAYHAELARDAANRLFGRDAVVFRNLSALMGTPRDKQRAWALLKSLPRNSAR